MFAVQISKAADLCSNAFGFITGWTYVQTQVSSLTKKLVTVTHALTVAHQFFSVIFSKKLR